MLAKDARVEVVPIAIEGTREALPKGGLLLQSLKRVPIKVRVLQPVPPEAAVDAEEMARLVHHLVESELEAMKKSSGVRPRS
jgi:1-acyl-sn-glycerol-3-phosphate acyltransferase